MARCKNSLPTHLAETDRLDLLHRILGLQSGQLSRDHDDIVFVAIDCESNSRLGKDTPSSEDFQMGLAILDTRDVYSARLQDLISMHNFALGSPAYKAIASDEFLFGESMAITHSQVRQKLESTIPQARNVVLVGHAIENEIGMLKHFGTRIENYGFAVFDTSKIGAKVFPHTRPRIRLGTLLVKLKCKLVRAHRVHCAGNDAHFTLRALLLLAAQTCIQTSENQIMLNIIKDLAYDPAPPRSNKFSLAEKTLPVRTTRKRPNTIRQRLRITKNRRREFHEMQRQGRILEDHSDNNLPVEEDWAASDLFDVPPQHPLHFTNIFILEAET